MAKIEETLANFGELMPKMKKIRLKTKIWLEAMFWQNWVNEKMVKFRPLSRPNHVRYFHAYVQ
jgi:hypothetical protein